MNRDEVDALSAVQGLREAFSLERRCFECGAVLYLDSSNVIRANKMSNFLSSRDAPLPKWSPENFNYLAIGMQAEGAVELRRGNKALDA